MKANPQITRPESAKEIGKSIRSVERTIEKLKKENKIERIGAKKEVIGKFWTQLGNSDKTLKSQSPRIGQFELILDLFFYVRGHVNVKYLIDNGLCSFCASCFSVNRLLSSSCTAWGGLLCFLSYNAESSAFGEKRRLLP